jgi:hypothetical protein
MAERRVDSFEYFREQLAITKEEYDVREPRTFTQYWHDYRRLAQWWAFWVAVTVLTFGVSQVEGKIQCYKACHSS